MATAGAYRTEIAPPNPQSGDNSQKIILSLFDYTGHWCDPYVEAGYDVVQIDIRRGQCIFEHVLPHAVEWHLHGIKIHGLLAAVPCTEFASSGARWWASKVGMPSLYQGKCLEFDDRLEEARAMVYMVLEVVELLQPEWWVIENPRGRIRKEVPAIGQARHVFQPWWYGDPYTKETFLYGNFNANLERNEVEPTMGSMAHRTSSTNKAKRSATPRGFARAFFNANP